MPELNCYLTFNGNCKEVFDFYRSVFGGEFAALSYFGDMPVQEGMPPLSEEQKNQVLHVSLPISKETILMGSDGGNQQPGGLIHGNNFAISINTHSREEADHFFNGLSAAGIITMPLQDTFWGAYFGMWTDKYGIQWMINFDDPAKVQS